jgi:hypothetical protein
VHRTAPAPENPTCTAAVPGPPLLPPAPALSYQGCTWCIGCSMLWFFVQVCRCVANIKAPGNAPALLLCLRPKLPPAPALSYQLIIQLIIQGCKHSIGCSMLKFPCVNVRSVADVPAPRNPTCTAAVPTPPLAPGTSTVCTRSYQLPSRKADSALAVVCYV